MLDRRHIRRQGSRSYTPLLLYVFPVLHQIRLPVDAPTQDPSLGFEASCFALPRGAVKTLLRRSMRNTTPRFWGCPAQARNSPVFDLEIAPNPIFVCAGQRISTICNVSLTETSAPICPSALCLFPGAESRRGRSLEKTRNYGVDLGFHEARKKARKPGERACRIHEDSERRSGASERTPRGSILCGRTVNECPFLHKSSTIQADFGVVIERSAGRIPSRFRVDFGSKNE